MDKYPRDEHNLIIYYPHKTQPQNKNKIELNMFSQTTKGLSILQGLSTIGIVGQLIQKHQKYYNSNQQLYNEAIE